VAKWCVLEQKLLLTAYWNKMSYLRMLDPIQNQALRLCLGAYRTSPATSLHVEANEMPIELRRRRLASQYSLKICSNLSNPARNCAFDERLTKLFDKRPNQIRPLGLRVKTDLSAIGFKQKDVFTSSIFTVPPWLLKPPSADLSLSSFVKAETIPEVFKSKFLEICDGLQGFCQIYTDGSKTTAQQQQP